MPYAAAENSVWTHIEKNRWREGLSHMRVTVHTWGPECGEQPTSTSKKGGATVNIQVRSPHLEIHAPDHVLRTDGCWSDNQALRVGRVVAKPPRWQLACETDPADARAEKGTYDLRLDSKGNLQAKGVHEYHWLLRGSECSLTVHTNEKFIPERPAMVTGRGESRAQAKVDPVPEIGKAVADPKEQTPKSKAQQRSPILAKATTAKTPTHNHIQPPDKKIPEKGEPPLLLLAFLAVLGTCIVAWWSQSKKRRKRILRDETEHG